MKREDPKPEVGMGATYQVGSDRYAGTITEVSENLKEVWFQYDDAIRVDGNGMSESQKYEFKPNKFASKVLFTLRKNGKYLRQGTPLNRGVGLGIGRRSHYYDFSF
jgi:hypothetical protein